MTEWQDIASAPKDGTVLDLQRVVDGKAMFTGHGSWRTVTFPEMRNGPPWNSVIEPEEIATGWMRDGVDKRFPEPTHWRPR